MGEVRSSWQRSLAIRVCATRCYPAASAVILETSEVGGGGGAAPELSASQVPGVPCAPSIIMPHGHSGAGDRCPACRRVKSLRAPTDVSGIAQRRRPYQYQFF